MENSEILKYVDHTLLSQTATAGDIEELLEDAEHYGVASVCIPPSYVAYAKAYAGNKVPIGTTVGFPNGYMTTEVKVFEAKEYIRQGACEIDMVANITWIKNGLYGEIEEEIKRVKDAVGDKILKVIIETCLLTEAEKIQMCGVVSAAGADYIKTSTGFSTDGATLADIRLFKAHVAKGVKIKAAGGIGSFDDARQFIEAGAHRLGTSRIVKLIKGQEAQGY